MFSAPYYSIIPELVPLHQRGPCPSLPPHHHMRTHRSPQLVSPHQHGLARAHPSTR